MKGQLKKSGIDIIGDVPQGTHFCQFYQTKEDLIEILVPYFKVGLENNEFCIWVTSQPLDVEEAKEALKKAVPDIDVYLKNSQIEIIPYTQIYTKDGAFEPERLLNGWVEKLDQALASGYEGLRSSGNISWLEKTDWFKFVNFEEKVDSVIGKYQTIALCTYPLDMCSATEIIDIVINHQFALIKREGKWEQIESSRRKKAEEAAIQAAKNWEYTFDAVPDLIAIIDDKYRIFRANKAMAAKLGIMPEECAGLICYRVVHGMDEPPSFCPHRQLLEDGLEHTREVREDYLGGHFIVSVSPLHDSKGKPTGCIHVARDIAERKQAEEALRESEDRLRFALETSHTGAWDLDIVDHTAYRSLEHDRIFGYEQLLPQWTYEMFLDHVLPEDRAMVDAKFRKATTEHSDWNFECRIRRVDDAVRWIWASGRHRTDAAGNVCRMAGIVQDITERKKSEEALRESEKRERARSEELAAVLDAVPVAVYIARDPQVLQITGNRLSYEWLRIPVGTNFSKSAPEEERPDMFKLFKDGVEMSPEEMPSQMAATGREMNDCELDIVSADGEIRHVLGNARPLRDEQGNLRGSISAFIDITGRKKAEEALKQANDNLENLVKERTVELEKAYKSLKESEAGLAEAQRIAHIGNWDWDIVTGKVHFSEEMYRIYGRNPQESGASYDELLDYIHPDDRDYVDNAVKKGLIGDPSGIDYRIILANGEERTVYIQAEVIFDEKNIPVQVKGIAQDITERKKAEQAIELSEERYRIIAEQTGQLVYDYNLEEDAADWAGNIEELTGYTPDEFRGMSLNFWLSCIHPEDQNTLLEKYENCMVSGDPYRMEYRFRKKSGEYIYFEDNGVFLIDKKRKVYRVIGVVKDITERKRAEMFVANIETARKKEIHHRIKNNLQVISSLLDLQSEKFRDREYVEDSEVLKAFRESQDRVMSIALIHEELHEGRGADTLNFSPYLEKLVNSLFQTYRVGNVNISLNIELEDNIFFDMDIAVPLGIIINELVSNSLKYAFTGKDNGLIQIKLSRERSAEYADSGSGNGSNSRLRRNEDGNPETNFALIVSDNGIGIPENFNSENSGSLGLQLVTILVDQLGGELELKRNNGTEFAIRFKVTEKSISN